MSEDKRDPQEEKEQKALRAKAEGNYRMGLEYEELSKILYYPPIVLKKNYELFLQDVTEAIHKMTKSPEYNPSIWGKVNEKWSKQIAEAQKFYKNGETSELQAAEEYIKQNKNVSQDDFAISRIFR